MPGEAGRAPKHLRHLKFFLLRVLRALVVQSSFSVHQIPEILHRMKGDQVSVVRVVGTVVAGAAEHVNIVAVDHHGSVVSTLAEIARVGDPRCEDPVDAVPREMEHQPLPLVVRQIETIIRQAIRARHGIRRLG